MSHPLHMELRQRLSHWKSQIGMSQQCILSYLIEHMLATASQSNELFEKLTKKPFGVTLARC